MYVNYEEQPGSEKNLCGLCFDRFSKQIEYKNITA